MDIGSPVNGRRESPVAEAAESDGDADVACSVAVLDEDGACALAVFFLISSVFFSSKPSTVPAAQSNAFATAIEELRACRGAGTRILLEQPALLSEAPVVNE